MNVKIELAPDCINRHIRVNMKFEMNDAQRNSRGRDERSRTVDSKHEAVRLG